MHKLVFLDRSTVPVPLPKLSFDHRWEEFERTDPAEVVPRLKDATIAITNKVALRQIDLERLPFLRMIAVAATGYDCVDVAWCCSHNVVVSNVPGYAQQSVADHTLMFILALRRNLLGYGQIIREGRWQQSDQFSLLAYPISDLAGAVLGIVGYGAIAQEVEKRAVGFGMRVLLAEHKGASSVRRGRQAFGEVLRQADVLSLHAPLTPETRNLIGAAEIGQMKEGALLINTARGGLVDASDLAAALRSGRLGGAAVDVLAEEPPRSGNPLLEPGLPNLIVTPHVAWSSREALRILIERLFRNIEAFVEGQPRNLVS